MRGKKYLADLLHDARQTTNVVPADRLLPSQLALVLVTLVIALELMPALVLVLTLVLVLVLDLGLHYSPPPHS